MKCAVLAHAITSYRKYTADSGQDYDGSPVAIFQSLSTFHHKQVSQELRFNRAAFGTLLEYTLGGIYFDQETVYETRESDPFVPFGTDPFNHPIFDFIQNDTTNNKDYTFYRLAIDGVSPIQGRRHLSAPVLSRAAPGLRS